MNDVLIKLASNGSQDSTDTCVVFATKSFTAEADLQANGSNEVCAACSGCDSG